MLDAVDPLMEFVINDAKPIAGKAKLIAGFEGECCCCCWWWWFCLGEELDDVGDDADEHDVVVVSVEPFNIWDEGVDRTLAAANRTAAAANGLIGGITGLPVGCVGEGGT